MKYRTLGSTNTKVSIMCLGTMTWGEQNTEEEGFAQMDFAFNQGVNFFDTAELYSVPPRKETWGSTERIIGKWLKQKKCREKIILATKVVGRSGMKWFRNEETRLNKKQIHEAVNGSLDRLKTDYIDLYQLHWPERSTNAFGRREFTINKNEREWNDFENILKALEKFIKSGKIRYVGISNETPYGLSKYLEISKNKNLPRMMSVQNPYSLVNRTYEVGMSEISIREKCGLLVYYPLASGALSGKYRGGAMPKNARMTLFKGWERMINPLAMKAYDEYYKLAKEHNITMVQLAQAFVNSRPFVTSNIIGATTMDQLKENIGSMDIELSEEILEKINIIHNNNPNPAP